MNILVAAYDLNLSHANTCGSFHPDCCEIGLDYLCPFDFP